MYRQASQGLEIALALDIKNREVGFVSNSALNIF